MLAKYIKTGTIITTILMLETASYAYPVQVCDGKVCQPLTYFESTAVIDEFVQLFQSGGNQILLCQADPEQKKCLDKPLTFSGRTNLMQVDFQIPFIRVLQKERVKNSLIFALDYQIQANEMYPLCSVSASHLNLFPRGEIQLTSSPFACRMTELGETSIAVQFQLDYVNLGTGWLGASYYATASGDTVGEGSGYVLMHVSDERSIELERIKPYDPKNVPEPITYEKNPQKELTEWYPEETRSDLKERGLVDWNVDWKNAWNKIKEKALKVIYLEPLND